MMMESGLRQVQGETSSLSDDIAYILTELENTPIMTQWVI